MPAACPPRLGGRPRRRCTARAGSPRSRFWNDSSPATHVIATSWVILHISRNLSKVCVQCHRGPPAVPAVRVTAVRVTAVRVTAVRVTAVPFGILVLGTVLLIGALSFLPVLALGPIAEYLKTAAGV